MGRIWSDQNKFQQWLEVELAASEALASAIRGDARWSQVPARVPPVRQRSSRRKSTSVLRASTMARTIHVLQELKARLEQKSLEVVR